MKDESGGIPGSLAPGRLWPRGMGRSAVVLAAALAATACTDRMAPSDDRWGRSGALIAQSGGEGGARYACVTCHGARGEGNGYDAPRLAGLPAGYLQKQMEDFAHGLRPHAVMRDVAGFLDSHERVAVSRYYAALPQRAMPPGTRAVAPPATAALYEKACAACHGPDGRGTPDGPPLHAQPAFYLQQQLQDWQAAARRNDGQQVMLEVARRLHGEELRHLSLFLSAIPLDAPAPAPVPTPSPPPPLASAR